MTAMLRTLEREEMLEAGAVRETDFLDSHPSTPDRIKSASELATSPNRLRSVAPKADQSAFFAHLDDMIVGSNPAEGVFVQRRFMHPDLRFSIEFPSEWMLQNSRAAIGAAAPNDRAVIMLQLLGDGNDPLVAADARKHQMGFSLTGVTRMRVGDLEAARVLAESRAGAGPVVMHVTWIAFDDRIYEIIGLTPPNRLEHVEPFFAATASSFAPLSPTQRQAIKVARMRSVTAKDGETVERLLDRVGSSWSPATATVANALEPGTPLRAGQVIKAPLLEVY
jgi:predicted Zn-dependent protease